MTWLNRIRAAVIRAITYYSLRRNGWSASDARDFARQYADETTMGDLA